MHKPKESFLSKLERGTEALLLVLRVRLGLYFQPNPTLKHFKSVAVQPYSVKLIGPSEHLSAEQLSHDIRRMSTVVPQATCLVQALAGKALLAKHGYKSELKLGVKKENDLKAHAWLEHNDGIVLGQLSNLSDYSVLKANTL